MDANERRSSRIAALIERVHQRGEPVPGGLPRSGPSAHAADLAHRARKPLAPARDQAHVPEAAGTETGIEVALAERLAQAMMETRPRARAQPLAPPSGALPGPGSQEPRLAAPPPSNPSRSSGHPPDPPCIPTDSAQRAADDRLEAALTRVVQARASRPLRGQPEIGPLPGVLSPSLSPKLGDMLVDRGVISAAARDAALTRQTASGQLLGAILLEAQAIDARQLSEEVSRQAGGRPTTAHILARLGMRQHHVRMCLERQRQSREPLTDIIRDWSLLSEEAIAKAIALDHNLEYLPWPDIDELPVDSVRSVRFVPAEYPGYVPIALASGNPRDRLSVALADTRLIPDAVKAFHGYDCHFHIGSPETCKTIYRRFFARTQEALDEALNRCVSEMPPAGPARAQLLRRLFAALLRHACCTGATNIALHRAGRVGTIRLKVDGAWRLLRIISKELLLQCVEVVRAEPNPGDSESLSDAADLRDRYAFRIVACNGAEAPAVAVRILDSPPAADLAQLGFSATTVEHLVDAVQAAAGVILVCGPADSGRTRSLYAILGAADPVASSIRSIESHVTSRSALWHQSTLAASTIEDGLKPLALRDVLRSPADKILLDEVADAGTARLVFRAADQGRLVLSAIDAQGAAEAISRLEDLGTHRHEMASLLRVVVGQRLIRKLCSGCKVIDDRVATHQALAGLDPARMKHLTRVAPFRARPGGCADCCYTGFRGRRMIHELLQCGRKFADLLENGASLSALRGSVVGATLRENGLVLMAAGITSLDELSAHLNLAD